MFALPARARCLSVLGALLALSLLPAAATGAGEAAPRYHIASAADLSRLDVRACFPGGAPRQLGARDRRAARYLRLPQGDAATHRDGRILLRDALPGGCLSYRVDLAAATGEDWRGPVTQTGGALLLSPQLFLWRPARDGALSLTFELPAGLRLSTPWARTGGTAGQPAFTTGTRPAAWDARIAIGDFTADTIRLPGGRLDVALLAGEPAPDRAMLRRWLRAQAGALATVYGRLPVPRVQVLVVPVGRGGEPVPWGQVSRGGGDAVHLYIDQTRPEDEFLADWVLVHELSHLLHPRIEDRGRWLYEGIASYYQSLLRARAGLLPPERAWDKLHAGFRRGIRATEWGESLAAVSAGGGEYMRVYWSGAAVALLADLALRRRSGGEQSLDTVLAAFADCCLPAQRWWGTQEFIAKLDDLAGGDTFRRLTDAHLRSERFPSLTAAYETLGLEAIDDRHVELRGDASARSLRRAIMGWD
ncbi:hypothetical protein CKO31_24415 [Thiohalocapsa halophila]|uniref:Peptidase M61 catalytic domain-containing protein n=1 Tax=Thiohalocapsa halophila TaxID=69359 RepID=A0ABS1CPL4_9GAMM|nr:hypothetical protein [Thiohalocapsa halophila]MBK1633820.1 hypothetical protein [Thiohalocapsa halophila]